MEVADGERWLAGMAPRPHAACQAAPLRLGGRLAGGGGRGVQPPVAHRVPVVPQQFGGMHSAARAIAAGQRAGGTVLVAAPANALGMLRMQGEFLCHGRLPLTTVDVKILPPPPRSFDVEQASGMLTHMDNAPYTLHRAPARRTTRRRR